MAETTPSSAAKAAPQTRVNSGVPVRKDARAKKLKENMRRRKEAVRSRDDVSEGA